MDRTKWAMLISGVVLTFVYFVALAPSSSGYGYSGHRSHVFWFSGGNSTVYHGSPSTRTGSTSGPRASSGGLSGGK